MSAGAKPADGRKAWFIHMFKEALLTIIAFVILFFILRRLLAKRRRTCQIFVIVLFTAEALCNTGYNLRHFFPKFLLDGAVPLGDCSGNLFLYNADSEYASQILFPVLKDRTVLLDSSYDHYDSFMAAFAGEVQAFDISEGGRLLVAGHPEQFVHISDMRIVRLMDYVFPDNEDLYLLDMLPQLYIRLDSISGSQTLVAVTDPYWNLYIMSEQYYLDLTEKEHT